jgi:hypothetical protein
MISNKEITDFFKEKDIHLSGNISVLPVFNLQTEKYYFIVWSSDNLEKETKLFLIDKTSGSLQVLQSAAVRLVPSYSKPSTLDALEKKTGTTGIAVWKPCRLSYSPFYPFWKIVEDNKVLFIDANNKLYSENEISKETPG